MTQDSYGVSTLEPPARGSLQPSAEHVVARVDLASTVSPGQF
jgi:hypothetical protein